ncbi:pyrimidine 5'-nucleotidase [Chitinibacter tainanensis]|uniref:pyrimidine 5'-nucleotidase n=1 Tax=Chitinibacter tainanensis TaxID=230667 RepID=UPI000414D4E5|nr:pyrimidine 5'-nucleotidase [Chitinibacter tainanensis]
MRPLHWIFDLDNTLHIASRHAFPVIDRAMTQWLQQQLAIDHHTANHLRVSYWQRYGATLLGLRRHHPELNPHTFLRACHPFAELGMALHPMPRLRSTLLQLAGNKYLFTNGPAEYGRWMLGQLGIADLFTGIAGIDTVGLRPKPQRLAFLQMSRHFAVPLRDCIMVEDSIDNLQMARRLGMHTVWLSPGRQRHPAAQHQIRHLHQLTQLNARLMR